MANEVIRAKYKGKDDGEGFPFFHGIPARDLTDSDFDALSEEDKQVVRSSALYDYVPYTQRERVTARPRQDEPTAQPTGVADDGGNK